MKTYKILDTPLPYCFVYRHANDKQRGERATKRDVLNANYLRGSSFTHISVKDTKQRMTRPCVPLRERLEYSVAIT